MSATKFATHQGPKAGELVQWCVRCAVEGTGPVRAYGVDEDDDPACIGHMKDEPIGEAKESRPGPEAEQEEAVMKEWHQEAVRLYRQGMSVGQVGKELGRPWSGVAYALKKAGIEIRKDPGGRKPGKARATSEPVRVNVKSTAPSLTPVQKLNIFCELIPVLQPTDEQVLRAVNHLLKAGQ